LLHLHEQLNTLFAQHSCQKTLIPDFLYLAVALVNGGAASFETVVGKKLKTEKHLLSKQATNWSSDIDDLLFQGSLSALSSEKVTVSNVKQYKELKLISQPIHIGGEIHHVFSILLATDKQSLDVFVLALQFMATCFGLWQQHHKQPAPAPAHSNSGSIVSIVSQLLADDDKIHGGTRLAQGIKDIYRADFVVLEPWGENREKNELICSSFTDIDSHSNLLHHARLSFEESRKLKMTLSYPSSLLPAAHSSVSSFVMNKLAGETNFSALLCIPITNQHNHRIGSLLLCWNKTPHSIEEAIEGLTSQSTLLSGMITWLYPHKNKPAFSSLLTKNRKVFFVYPLITVAIVTALFMPVTFKIDGECILEPRDIRYVVAQFDGTLKEVMVKPGDTVQAGETLAQLDRREIELQLNSLYAEIQRTRKVRAMNMASSETAMVQMAELERKSLEGKYKLLEDRVKKLLILSPIDGTIISGSLEQHQGSPVNRGQQLFEIAPFSSMIAEANIRQEDISFINEKAEVTVKLDSFPGKPLKSSVSLIYPRSELREGESVFIVEAGLINQGHLHPGMRGKVEINAGTKPLLYILFRRPWIYIQQLLHSF